MTARALVMLAGSKAYAGAAPVTRASGKKLVVLHRSVKNNRLAAVGYVWTLTAIRLSTGARAQTKNYACCHVGFTGGGALQGGKTPAARVCRTV